MSFRLHSIFPFFYGRFYDWLRSVIEPVVALVVVDVQNDFIEGSLALRDCGCNQDGVDVVELINRLIKEGQFNKVIYSLDWHPENHISFYENLHLRELHADSKVRNVTGNRNSCCATIYRA